MKGARYYPTVRYHRTLPPRDILTPEEDAALGPEWADTPAAFYDDPEPTVTADDPTEGLEPEPVTVKRRPGRPKKVPRDSE